MLNNLEKIMRFIPHSKKDDCMTYVFAGTSMPRTSTECNRLLIFIAFSFALISFSVVGQRYVYIALVLLYLYLLNLYQRNPYTAVTKFIYAMPIVFIVHIAWTLYNCYCNVGFDIVYQPLLFLIY